MSNTVSADSIWAHMPHNVLARVLREPTHKQINMVIRELTANLMAVSCPWGHGKGHLGRHQKKVDAKKGVLLLTNMTA